MVVELIKKKLAKRYLSKAVRYLARMKKDESMCVTDVMCIFKNLRTAYTILHDEEPELDWHDKLDFEKLLSQVVTDIQRLS